MSDKLTLPISIIIAGLLIGGGVYLNGRIENSKPPTQNKILSDNAKNSIRPIDVNDHILGSAKARVLLVEYSDTECPFCKEFHSTMLRIMKEYGSDERVAWVYRHFPIAELHSKAPKEAEALECAAELGGNAKFWEYTNRLYEITPSDNNLDPKELTNVAKYVGLSSDSFNTCLESGQYAPRVEADLNNAKEMGAEGTPYSVIIDTKTDEHYPLPAAYPYTQLKAVIDLILQS